MDELVNHVIGRTEHIIGLCAFGNAGIHALVGVVFIEHHLDARFFLELLDDIFTEIIAPAVDIEHICALVLLLGKHIAATHQKSGHEQQGQQKFLHHACPLFSA